MEEIISKVINILATLSIPSLAWNIYLYRENKKFKKFPHEKELIKKEIEFEEMLDRHAKQFDEWQQQNERQLRHSERSFYINTPSVEDSFSELKKRQRRESRSMMADIEYRQKMLTCNYILSTDSGFINNLRKWIKSLIVRLTHIISI